MKDRSKIEQPVAVEFQRFNDEFAASLRSETNRLQSAIDQILNASGKHVRPLLVLLTAKACGQVTDNTINSAVLLELLHTATLIHDDVIDETKQRRGVPSLNAIFDNRISVLVGDYVLSTAANHRYCFQSRTRSFGRGDQAVGNGRRKHHRRILLYAGDTEKDGHAAFRLCRDRFHLCRGIR